MGVGLEVKRGSEGERLARTVLRDDASGAVDVAATGPNTTREILFLHGFSQSTRCMGPLVELLGRNDDEDDGQALALRITALDLPGHGDSGEVVADDLWAVADLVAISSAPATLVGYSMGGRVALHVALTHPQQVRGLVLIGATAGIEDAVERQARRQRDNELAAHLETVGVEQFTDEWLRQELFRDLPAWARFTAERHANRVEGLARSLRNCGTGTMEPLWSRLATITAPVLVLAGARDGRFCALGARLAAAIGPNAGFRTVPAAGHAAHLEQPAATAALITDFLRAQHR